MQLPNRSGAAVRPLRPDSADPLPGGSGATALGRRRCRRQSRRAAATGGSTRVEPAAGGLVPDRKALRAVSIMSEPAYSRLLCTPRPALGAALGCCHRSRLALEQLRGQVSGLGSQLRGQLADLSSAAVPKVTGLLQDLPRVFCAPTAKFSEGSFLDRLPAAMVEKVTSTVITKGPHKLAPIVTDGPLKPASVAPSERRLSITDGAVIARPETPPATEADDSASSDVDSGTADVMDDLPSPGTPEPEEEEEEEEDGIREEDRHRVVISVTQDLAEIHGPLGCQEVPPVVVRLKPGDQGRYGFNVKGGAGSNIPVTVSKVAPRSAICCNGPRLSKGDQVSASSRATVGSCPSAYCMLLLRGERGELYHVQVVSGRIVPNLSNGWRSRHDQPTRFSGRHLSLFCLVAEWTRLEVRADFMFF
ncbi:Tyrosine-protein phosphatase 1 [Amphibalanus amphitrite]|uniref:Tyrosine-protein phosphatase 1 n=1 Tax=Amphibalanus amphitrite TaxID=1232801 RepID=A0A6A4W8W3_AMPAM|nr:Tyrosine-protein phosphatase 1 [Amphibalanus amphitrite]